MNPVKLTLEQMRDKVAGAQALLDEVFHGLGDFDAAIQTTESGDSVRATDQGNGGSSSAAASAAPAASLVAPTPAGGAPARLGGKPSRPLRVALIIGHEPGAPGAHNPGTRESEFVFNSRLAPLIEKQVRELSGGLVGVLIVMRHPEGQSALPRKVNATGADIVIELHANAADGTATGSEMICLPGSEEANRVGRFLLDAVVKELGLRDRGVKGPWAGRGEYLLRNTRMPCVIAEPFFIDNDDDYKRALTRERGLAAAYAQGILDAANDRWRRGLWK